jgi:RNA polymerase sigma-70 factor (ECF subfamily)
VLDWTQFVDDFGPMAYRSALRIVGRAADAEDVVQEVFLEVHRVWQSRDVVNWQALLRSLATRRAIDLLRKRKRNERLRECVPDLAGVGPDEFASGQEYQAQVRDAIARLPRQQAEVVSLHYLEEQSHQAIADALNISTHAVSAALYKARMKLERSLRRTQYENR